MPTVGSDVVKAQAEEERQAKALVDAAKSAGVQHFIYFSLPHSDVPHFESVIAPSTFVSSDADDMPKSQVPICRVSQEEWATIHNRHQLVLLRKRRK